MESKGLERRHYPERRHASVAVARDRRRGDRRRQIARAGIVAAMALLARPVGRELKQIGSGGTPVGSVEVGPEQFRMATYDRTFLNGLIDEAASVHGVSADLVRAVVQTESAFNPMAVSPVGAQGLMQLMPDTAKRFGVEDPFDPRQNVFGGTKYLSHLLGRFNGNVALALAGYNAGPRKVQRYKGIPPFKETRGYVTKIRGLYTDATGESFPMPLARVQRRAPRTRAHATRLVWRGRAKASSRPSRQVTAHRSSRTVRTRR
jgi:soluble lytic murein transglycosylase-like protein